MINNVFHNQVNGHCFQRPVSSPELLNNVGVMDVKGVQEKHDEKKTRNDDLAEAVKQRQKSNNRLVISFEIVEDCEQGGKGIGNRVRATVGIQRSKHFKTVTIVVYVTTLLKLGVHVPRL